MFRLEIQTGNAAFDRPGEIERILTEVRNEIMDFGEPAHLLVLKRRSAKLVDVNGNTVGKWEFVDGNQDSKPTIDTTGSEYHPGDKGSLYIRYGNYRDNADDGNGYESMTGEPLKTYNQWRES